MKELKEWLPTIRPARAYPGVELPLRSELFSTDQMREHGKTLARSHKLSTKSAASPLLARLDDNENVLNRVYALLDDAAKADRSIAPAGEWLLDNFYLIEEQIRLARRHLPKSYSRELPRLMNGPSAGLPRVYDIALEAISHGDGRLEMDGVASFVASYQTITTLKLGELWAIPTMLRLALIENLRRVGTRMAAGRLDRNRADYWADRLTEIAQKDPKSLIMAIADMTRASEQLSSAFVAELARRLQGQGSALALPLTWIEQRLSEFALTIKKLVQAENQEQATDQVSISNSIGSLRLLARTDWRDFVESMSEVELVLHRDPTQTYAKMTFATRDRYRHVVERVARLARCSEKVVASKAVELATVVSQKDDGSRASHVGYYLVDKGLKQLELASGIRHSSAERVAMAIGKYPLAVYAGSIALLTAFLAGTLLWIAIAGGLQGGMVVLLGIAAFLSVSQFATGIVNRVATFWVPADALPRMDMSEGIPPESRTLTVIPTMLTSAENIEVLVEALEVRFLANRDRNLYFALLTDFHDADQQSIPEDEPLLHFAKSKIEQLNEKYGQGDGNAFFLFHRPRLWNPSENLWIGYERKRGKLSDLNAFLRNAETVPSIPAFSLIVGDTKILATVRYVITLDTDTQLPRDSAKELIGALAHPLNRARYDPARHRVVEGYGILQPRVSVSLPGTNRSRYARMFGSEAGIDPYTRAVSDVYQDVFGEGSFVGKGIYDVDAFELALAARLPDNLILSHDLIEGCYARAALLSDVQLYEEYPSQYSADVSRRRRWIRGDWQIAQWLLPRVPGFSGRSQGNPISMLSRWKVLDNLRRSLLPAALVLFLVLSWIVLPAVWPWTLSIVAIIMAPALIAATAEAARKPRDVEWQQHLKASLRSTTRSFEQSAFTFACLPYEALFSLGAVARTVVRMVFTRKRLLEWKPSRSTAHRDSNSFVAVCRSMWIGPAAAAVMTVWMLHSRPAPFVQAMPLLGLWFVAPIWAWWLGQPRIDRTPTLRAEQVAFLERLSRRTWAFFETFVGPDDNWLPPDNFQESPAPVVGHRTSPTNIGLALLANLTAYDFGYITTATLLERTSKTFHSMGALERYRGHFYNWYDTQTLKPLLPLYVSTVDSGNLAGHLLTLRGGLLALLDHPIRTPQFFKGIHHSLSILTEIAEIPVMPAVAQIQKAITAAHHDHKIERLAAVVVDVTATLSAVAGSETRWWIDAVNRQCQDALRDLSLLQPANSNSHSTATLREISKLDNSEVGLAARDRIAVIEQLAVQATEFATMEMDFLLDRKSRLLTIGFNVNERRQDSSHYDLLASEARLASFVAIAQGQAPQEIWFALGRLLNGTGGDPVLVSWSGSMFEYLMPLLVMPTYENTLLDQTCRAAVKRQIDYGEKRGVPWGISECGYNAMDAQLNYQYRAFGVPGLGFKNGLAGDLVIAPYASALALMVDPESACSNLVRLADAGLAGRYGLYEAVDYTPSRLSRGRSNVVIRSFMAHHQGMSFLSLAYLLLDRPMQKRFASDPALQATLLLLQERIPKATRTFAHSAELADEKKLSSSSEPALRVFTSPNTPTPEVQLLSNGRYHVMVTNAGGGYSRWKDLAVTRWREDGTQDNWGTFCYIRDVTSGDVWSASHQPVLKSSNNYEAIFSESRVEFRRRDKGIETHMEIAVSPEDDIELRRVSITNSSRTRRTIDVTSYAEVVLASAAADALHPAFSNLFVETEILRERRAILCTRRPRSAGEFTPWMFHLMVAEGATSGEVSYETDRMRFIGRGRTVADPQAHSAPLSGSEGSVLDPIVAVRHRMTLDPGETVRISIVTGVAESKSLCMDLVDKYQDPRFSDRTFDLAWTHSQVLLRQINATERDAQLYGRLAGSVIYANSSLRANPGILAQNRRNQSGLWGYTISGDLPIVLLRIADPTHIELVRQLVQAHTYWRLKGLIVDLVIWNEDQAGYRQPLNDQIMGLIAAGIEADVMDRPGGILVRLADHIAPEDRILLQTVARAIITDSAGSLEQQLSSGNTIPENADDFGMEKKAKKQISALSPASEPSRDRIFFNGFGGFTNDGREYVITTTRDRMTPAPWVNVLANKFFGSVLSEAGSATTWSENAHEFRLTPWSNDPVGDPSGESIYIRDDESGFFWTPTLLPCGGRTAYVTRHGFGYTVYEHIEDGIQSELWVYVAVDSPIKFSVLKLRNNSGRPRRLSVFGYVEWVLGDLRSKSMMHVVTETEADSGATFARNPYSTEFGDRTAFFDVNVASHIVTGDRKEFLGRNGKSSNPAAMGRSRLSGKGTPGMDPCSAIQVSLELEEADEQEVIFTLGAEHNIEAARSLAFRFRGSAAARGALEAVWQYWNQTLGKVQVETPDSSINVLLNGWLVYQTLACRFWARSGFYQPGGAFGFRDQMQDAMALIHIEPRLVREHLLLCAAHQFREGDVQHWWHPPSDRGVRTRCSDDYLWLPLVACRYASATGDTGVWDEPVRFIEGRLLKPEEESYYDLPENGEATCSLYDHCTRAVLWGLRYGGHGLPLMGSGDWNDGMNLVGQHGKGESVWLAFFLFEVLKEFGNVARMRDDVATSERCHSEMALLQESIEKNGWDGEWYRRAYFDDGTPLGSATNTECQIDSISQSWSVLSGAADRDRSRQAMTAVDERLVRRESNLVQLLDPPFDKSGSDPGYIKGYVPGVRENGGQYTHAAIWSAMAFAELGNNARAWELLSMINPVNRGGTPQSIATYCVEPYVVAADVYARPPHTGRGGWTWYTGSAGWMYQFITGSLLGFRIEANKLHLHPRIPPAWSSFKIHYRYRETVYHITVLRLPKQGTEARVVLDGVPQTETYLSLIDDRKDHHAELRFYGPSGDLSGENATAENVPLIVRK